MDASRRALLDVARDLDVPRARYPDRSQPTRVTLQPRPLELAVLAIQVAEALELIAAEEVERARELDGVTWDEVGAAFDTSMQSAHARFRRCS